jgi:hypothetical protein
MDLRLTPHQYHVASSHAIHIHVNSNPTDFGIPLPEQIQTTVCASALTNTKSRLERKVARAGLQRRGEDLLMQIRNYFPGTRLFGGKGIVLPSARTSLLL